MGTHGLRLIVQEPGAFVESAFVNQKIEVANACKLQISSFGLARDGVKSVPCFCLVRTDAERPNVMAAIRSQCPARKPSTYRLRNRRERTDYRTS
jgi:hypothetical protein